MKGCCLSLLGQTWAEFFVRRQTIKGESELIVKWIQSIFWTGLWEEGTIMNIKVVKVGYMKNYVFHIEAVWVVVGFPDVIRF